MKLRTLSVLALLVASSTAPLCAQSANPPPYPGSREHVGVVIGNQVKKQYFYDQRTLVKTWIFKDHAAEAPAPLTMFAEPKSEYFMVGRKDVRSKQVNPPVPVLLMKPGGPAAKWTIGPLPAGTYMFRIIGAIPAADQVEPQKLLTLSLTINDRLGGAKSQYVLRGRGVDSFYCVQEFGFHAFDDRSFVAEVSLLDDSQTSLYAYNFEIHDIFGPCAKAAGKTQPSFFTLEEREIARKAFAETEDGKKMLATIRSESKRLSAEQRRKRDDDLWHSVPPPNGHFNENYISVKDAGKYPIKLDYLFDRDKAKWWMHHRIYGGTYGSNWDQRFALAYDEWGNMARRPVKPEDTYSLEDWLAHKPLGDTGDRGWGVMKSGTLFIPSARIHTTSWEVLARRLSPDAMDRYHLGGDEAYARDMAFALIRFAWDMPIFSPYHCTKYLAGDAEVPWLSNRFYQWKIVNDGFAMAYDKLFPFIQGNEELAQAVGRYIPSIRKPEDVIRMLDTHLVQYMARNVLENRYFYDNGSADILLDLAIVQANAQITEPWMEHLFTKGVYFYPIGHQPLPHVLSTNTKRDGSSEIGSIHYTSGGGPAVDAAERIDRYMRLGGLAKYDLRDFNRYPEAIAGCYWPLEQPAAGLQYLGIGDVGGPSERYGRFCEPAEKARSGWRWTKDPKFAWLLVNVKGRQYESDAEWAEITKAAKDTPDPIMNKRTRLLADWSGILESGVGDPDFRFHRAAAVRVGWGYGHAHKDALDLRVWAHGCTLLGDLGQRGGYGKPDHGQTMAHNLVQIDEENVGGHSWVSALADMPGIQYLQAHAVPTVAGMLKRQTALIDVDEGTPSPDRKRPHSDDKVVTPNSYVFDVCRTRGGSTHTFAFHGCVDDLHFDVNVPESARTVWPRDATPERAAVEKQDPDAEYMRDFRWTRLDQVDPETKKTFHVMGEPFRPADADWKATIGEETLQATWRLSRAAEARMIGGCPGAKVTEPRKYTRLHLFNARGLRLLHGIIIDKVNAAAINPDYPHYAGRTIYVRKPGSESVFVSLVEPYAGEPFIADRRFLPIQPADASAEGAVAVEATVNVRANEAVAKRTDILFADNSGQMRTVPAHGLTVQGEFASVQKTGDRIEKACLVRGRQLKIGGLEITTDRAEYRARIKSIDYLTRELTLDSLVPAEAFKGAVVEIGDATRLTSYDVGEVVQRDGATILKLPRSLELKRTRVDSASPAGGTTVLRTSMQIAEAGVWASNGNYSKLWRVIGRRGDAEIALQGQATMADFQGKAADLVTLEIAAGQDVILAGRISVERKADNSYDVRSNVAVKVRWAGGAKDFTPKP